jgi:multiple sugar transport system substrate-binding protein
MTNVKRKGVLLALIVLLIASLVPAASFAANPIKLVVNGKAVQADVPPQMIEGRTMVPVRWVAEALGATVVWDGNKQAVLVNSSADKAGAKSGEIQLVVNNKVVKPDVAPVIVDGRTMVPVRWVAEALGSTVGWDQATQTVTVQAEASAGGSTAGVTIVPNQYGELFEVASDELFIFVENYKPWEYGEQFNDDAGRGGDAAERDLGTLLRAKFPNIKFKIAVWDYPVRSAELAAAGIAPDIYLATSRTYIDRVLEENGWEYDMTDLIKQYGIELSKLNHGAVEQIKAHSDGGMYGVPIFIREYLMFYKKEFFDAKNEPYPFAGMTWDQYYEKISKVKGQVGVRTIKGSQIHPDQYLDFNQLGLYPFTPGDTEHPNLKQMRDSVNVVTDEWLHLVENMYRFLAMPGNNFVTVDDFFRLGTVATAIETVDRIPQLKLVKGHFDEEDTKMFEQWAQNLGEFGVAPVPVFPEAPNTIYQPNALTAHVTKQSNKKEQSMEVIKWLVSEEAQIALSKKALKGVLKTDAVVDAFGKDIPALAEVEGLAEAVYWGENAAIKNYQNTEYIDAFPLYLVFRQYVLKEGNPANIALQRLQTEGVPNFYKWNDDVLREKGLIQ